MSNSVAHHPNSFDQDAECHPGSKTCSFVSSSAINAVMATNGRLLSEPHRLHCARFERGGGVSSTPPELAPRIDALLRHVVRSKQSASRPFR